MENTQSPDAELVSRALLGAQEAYRELVTRFERPVTNLIVRMVRDPATAEDLAQEAFLKAFRNLRRYDPERKFSSWLFKIAHNTTIDFLRRKQLDWVPLEAPDASGGEATREVIAAPSHQSPDEMAVRSEWGRGLEHALGELRPEYREILILRFQEELAYDEIAEVLGVAMGTVKVQLHRARKQLAKQLVALGFEPPPRWTEKARAKKEAKRKPSDRKTTGEAEPRPKHK